MASPSPPTFAKRPNLALKRGVDYWAVVRTSCGDFKMDLLEGKAPRTVANFVFLARRGFYDGLTWHRVVYDFVIQTGDPNGLNGVTPDGPGYTIKDELWAKGRDYTYGAVGLANTGKPDTGGSQFFIVVHDVRGALKGKGDPLDLEPTYTLFGRVPKRFFGSLENIARQPTFGATEQARAAMPLAPVYTEEVAIVEKGDAKDGGKKRRGKQRKAGS